MYLFISLFFYFFFKLATHQSVSATSAVCWPSPYQGYQKNIKKNPQIAPKKSTIFWGKKYATFGLKNPRYFLGLFFWQPDHPLREGERWEKISLVWTSAAVILTRLVRFIWDLDKKTDRQRQKCIDRDLRDRQTSTEPRETDRHRQSLERETDRHRQRLDTDRQT